MEYHAKVLKECESERKSKDSSYLAAMQVFVLVFFFEYHARKCEASASPSVNPRILSLLL